MTAVSTENHTGKWGCNGKGWNFFNKKIYRYWPIDCCKNRYTCNWKVITNLQNKFKNVKGSVCMYVPVHRSLNLHQEKVIIIEKVRTLEATNEHS